MLVRARRSAAAAAAQAARLAISTRDAQRAPYPQAYLQLGLALARPTGNSTRRSARCGLHGTFTKTSLSRLPRRLGIPRLSRGGGRRTTTTDACYPTTVTTSLTRSQVSGRQHAAQDDPRIQLHLALALRALIERETLVEAQTHARRYLELGAPLGFAHSLTDFVLPVAEQTEP